MKVYKTCLLIAKRCIGVLMTFCGIFITISIISSKLQGEQMEAAFQGEAVPYTIINRDNDSPIAEGLRSYLQSQAPETTLEDEDLVLQEALFYGETDYIIIVPKGFQADWPNQKLQIISSPGAMTTYYMDQMVESYLTQVKLQQQIFPAEPEKAIANALESLSQKANVEKQRFGMQQEMNEGYQIYYRMVGYALMVIIFQFISSVQLVYGRREIRMRHGVSPVSSRRITTEIGVFGLMVSALLSLILMLIGYAMHSEYLNAGGWQLILLVYLNEAAFMFVAIALSVLLSQFTKNETVQSVISNVTTLSLSFLGGLFVPIQLLSSQIQSIAHLLPTYWYVDTFSKINDLSSYTAASMQPVWQGLLIQLAYAGTLFCLGLLVAKYKRMEA